jgi:hypothetical protein
MFLYLHYLPNCNLKCASTKKNYVFRLCRVIFPPFTCITRFDVLSEFEGFDHYASLGFYSVQSDPIVKCTYSSSQAFSHPHIPQVY